MKNGDSFIENKVSAVLCSFLLTVLLIGCNSKSQHEEEFIDFDELDLSTETDDITEDVNGEANEADEHVQVEQPLEYALMEIPNRIAELLMLH